MIVVDTNVISEMWKIKPDAVALAWLDAQRVETLFLSAITVAELRFGVAAMPDGRRRNVYQDRLEHEVLPTFADRVLAFDLAASQAYAEVMTAARVAGQTIGKADGLIAATARARGMTVATRDTHPFEAAGLKIINPWKAVL